MRRNAAKLVHTGEAAIAGKAWLRAIIHSSVLDSA